jgi:hypothetical protein
MSATNAPFGLRIVQKLGGTPVSLTEQGTITSGYATAIGFGDPVKLVAGVLQRATGLAATDGASLTVGGIVGAFMGVEYTDANGRRQESNQWLASTVATNIVAYYSFDPYITYEIQANGSIAASQIGAQADFATLGPASTTIGISGGVLDTATISTSVQKELRIVGLSPGPFNAYGDAFTIVKVQIAKHQYAFPQVPIA